MNAPKGVEGFPEIRKAFEYALERVGTDATSGPLWMDYFQFLQRPRAGDPAFVAMFGASLPGQEENNRAMALRYRSPGDRFSSLLLLCFSSCRCMIQYFSLAAFFRPCLLPVLLSSLSI